MNTIEKKSVKAGKYVNQQEVNTYIDAYKKDRWMQNSDRMGKADSLSVWFTVEELEGFLATVKENGGNGVRFHFGTFSENHVENPLVSGLQNIVMIGTRSKDGSYETAKQLYAQNGETSEIVAYGNGIPCPPLCGPGGKGRSILIQNGEKGLSII